MARNLSIASLPRGESSLNRPIVHFLVAARGKPGDALEDTGEVRLLSESGLEGNVDNRHLGMDKPVAREVDAAFSPELPDGGPIISVELAGHVHGMHLDFT